MKLEEYLEERKNKELEEEVIAAKKAEQYLKGLEKQVVDSLFSVYPDVMSMLNKSDLFSYNVRKEMNSFYFFVSYNGNYIKFNIGKQELESRLYLSRDAYVSYFLWEHDLKPITKERFLDRIYEELYKEKSM